MANENLIDKVDRDLALHAKEGNYLVSAGAGSGKTYTLTNRILELVLEKDASGKRFRSFKDLLVLTFTKKAAAEMKERTRKNLGDAKKDGLIDEKEFASLSTELEQASIMTFDAFALDVVKKYHYELGLGKDVTNLDEAILSVAKKNALEKIMERHYEEAAADPDCPFAKLITRHEVRDDDDIVNIVLLFDALAEQTPDKEAFLDTYISTHYSDEYFEEAFEKWYQAQVAGIERLIDEANKLYGPESEELQSQVIDSIRDLLLLKGDKEKFLTAVNGYRAPKLPKGEKEIHEAAHAAWKKKKDDAFAEIKSQTKNSVESHRQSIKARYFRTKEDEETIVSLVKELDAAMEEFKKEHNAWSFADIAKLAQKAARIPSVSASLHERYKYVMIDEYQDTNDLQEDFIASLHCDNVYAVGDIKQSIYGFRNAKPELFASKFEKYGRGEGGTLLKLQANFRSRSPILDSVNDIFGTLMSLSVGGVNYGQGHALAFGQNKYQEDGKERHDITFVTYPRVQSEERGITEARLIASDIIRKKKEGYLVYDKEKETLRPCEYGDFAILVDKRSELNDYKKAFTEYQIPFEASEKGDRSHSPLTFLIKNLAKLTVLLVEEPSSKSIKHCFMAIARSFAFSYKDDVLYRLIKDGTYDKEPYFVAIKENAKKLLRMHLSDALSFFIEGFDIVNKISLLSDVKANLELLLSFESLAENMAKLGYGLKEFAEYFDDLDRYEETFNVEPNPSGLSTVRFMTIHQSKGLEFPIVYCPSLFHQFESNNNRSANNSAYLVSLPYGLILPAIDPEDNEWTIFHFLEKKRRKEEAISERMRLLYVALTRPKEQCYLILPEENPEKPFAGTTQDAKTFANFLALYPNKNGKCGKEKWGVEPLPEAKGEQSDNPKGIVFEDIPELSLKELGGKRASKELVGETPYEAFIYGEKMHRLLELSDFATKDVSWIQNQKDREKIEKVLALPLFENAKNAKVFHEYRFYDDESGHEGSIDLLLVYEDHIDLVDFKSGDIEDEAYPKQLAMYEKHLKKVFKQPIKKYLLSIRECRIKGVD